MLTPHTICDWLRKNRTLICTGILWGAFAHTFIAVATWSITLTIDPMNTLVGGLLVFLPPGILCGCLAGVLTIWIQNIDRRGIAPSAVVAALSLLGTLGGLFAGVLAVENLLPVDISGPVILLIGWSVWIAGAALVESSVAATIIVISKLIRLIGRQ